MASQGQTAASLFDINLTAGSMALVLLVLIAATMVAAPAAQAQTLTVLYNFGNGGVGSEPLSGLIMDQAGRLYGTTYDGDTRIRHGLSPIPCRVGLDGDAAVQLPGRHGWGVSGGQRRLRS